jgi:hypothetical protein
MQAVLKRPVRRSSVGRALVGYTGLLSITHDERKRNAIDVRTLHKAMRDGIGQFGGVCAPGSQIQKRRIYFGQ